MFYGHANKAQVLLLCAYGSMLNSVDMVNIQEAELTIKEQKLLNNVRLQELHRHNLGAWLHWNN